MQNIIFANGGKFLYFVVIFYEYFKVYFKVDDKERADFDFVFYP